MDVTYFESPAEFRAWLEAHHATETQVWVGYYKAGSGRRTMTWAESVDQALCFGWIDGVRKRIDGERFAIRFTPRKRGSIWSAVNVQRAQELAAQGLLRPAGMSAYAARREARTAVYAYEQRGAGLDAAAEARLRADAMAWSFWQAQPPWYRKTASWWVVSARREATRRARLEALIADCAAGRRIKQLSRPESPSETA